MAFVENLLHFGDLVDVALLLVTIVVSLRKKKSREIKVKNRMRIPFKKNDLARFAIVYKIEKERQQRMNSDNWAEGYLAWREGRKKSEKRSFFRWLRKLKRKIQTV